MPGHAAPQRIGAARPCACHLTALRRTCQEDFSAETAFAAPRADNCGGFSGVYGMRVKAHVAVALLSMRRKSATVATHHKRRGSADQRCQSRSARLNAKIQATAARERTVKSRASLHRIPASRRRGGHARPATRMEKAKALSHVGMDEAREMDRSYELRTCEALGKMDEYNARQRAEWERAHQPQKREKPKTAF